jgi:apolipoprotein D and lipocalin family protein
MKAISAITAALLLGTAEASISDGACSSYTSQASFDKAKYLGKWHEIHGDYGNPGEFGAACTTAQYRLKTDGDIQVTNRGNYWWLLGGYVHLGGDARCNNSDGRCTVAFYGSALTNPENYKILSTDYTSYTIVYNCNDKDNNQKEEILWIMGRNPTLDDATFAAAKARVLEVSPSYDFDTNLKKQYNKADCQYEWDLDGSSLLYEILDVFIGS